MTPPSLRAAIYARVSTFDQEPENQLAELRRYEGGTIYQDTAATVVVTQSGAPAGATPIQ